MANRHVLVTQCLLVNVARFLVLSCPAKVCSMWNPWRVMFHVEQP